MTEEEIKEQKEKIRRTVVNEIVRMEDDFDQARTLRNVILGKIMEDVNQVKLHDEHGALKEDADVGMRVYTTALKTLADIEKASATAINIKLRNKELDMASATDSKNRIAVLLASVAPGKIEGSFPAESLEEHLAEMFDAEIKDTELKTNPRCLDE